MASQASARSVFKPPPVVRGSTYLALGDSVTFGFMEPNVVPAPNYSDASSFVGYPEIVGRLMRIKTVNAACPGETSASFVNPSAQSNGCENSLGGGQGYRPQNPLHVGYKGSQLAFARLVFEKEPQGPPGFADARRQRRLRVPEDDQRWLHERA